MQPVHFQGFESRFRGFSGRYLIIFFFFFPPLAASAAAAMAATAAPAAKPNIWPATWVTPKALKRQMIALNKDFFFQGNYPKKQKENNPSFLCGKLF